MSEQHLSDPTRRGTSASRASSRRPSVAVLALIGLAFGLAACAATLQAPPAAQPAQQAESWLTYTSDDAAFAFDYPADAAIETSEDAALPYKLVYARFAPDETAAYQGASIMVLENPQGAGVRDYVAARYAAEGRTAPLGVTNAAGFQVNGREAIKLERDDAIGNLDKYTVLVAGDGVIYRINLYGGGIGGPVEPPPSAEAAFDRLVGSFRVLDQPLRPRAPESGGAAGGSEILSRPEAPGRSETPGGSETRPYGAGAEPPAAAVFTYPLRSAAGVNYGVPLGIVSGGTRLEWLDYGIRNLDQWRIKCYGVDWTRMIHTGEDWYRDDYLTANTAGSPVYAVADGVVDRHDPGISYPGNVVLIRHRLPDGRSIYSMYGHVTNVRVVQGQQVTRGQQIATVFNQGYVGRTPNRHPSWDSHLHFEMRWFRDGTNIYVPGTNAYGYNYPACTYAYPGRGYTYIVHPDHYPYPSQGYVDGSDFIAARLNEPAGCTPSQLVQNGGFEAGLPGTPWVASNSLNKVDPLIYRTRPRTGAWGGWLGNIVNYSDVLSQVVAVPTDTVSATLTFWRYVQSLEPAGSGNDRMTAALTAPDGSAIGSPRVVTSAAARGRWAQEIVSFPLAGYAFPTATLALSGSNDGANKSSFFLDDVALVRQCAAGAALDAGAAAEWVEVAAPTSVMTTPLPLAPMAYLPIAVTGVESDDKDEALAATCRDVVANGGFEDAANPIWTGVANTASTIYNVLPNGASSGVADPLIYTAQPRTGARSGRVGASAVNGYWNELVQTVQLPSNAISMTLTYWRYLDTQETSTATAYDVFRIGLETEKGIQIVGPQQIDNRSAGRGQWVQETLNVPNAVAYSNQKLWVTFKGTLDGNQPSALYVDDVAVEVCALR